MEKDKGGSKLRVACRYRWKCNRRKCPYAHPSPAACVNDKGAFPVSIDDETVVAQNATKIEQDSTHALLQNFQKMFNVQGKLIDSLSSSLADISCKVAIIFVDLDNVPRFFERITPEMIAQLQYEIFIICSANSSKKLPCKSSGKVHFSLASMTKDAADAVCIVAAAKLHSVLVQGGRQSDVPLIIVSDDKIFSQVPSSTLTY
jgi:hypothetical protein